MAPAGASLVRELLNRMLAWFMDQMEKFTK